MRLASIGCVLLATMIGGKVCGGQSSGSKTQSADMRSMIAGVWRGHSVCVDKDSPCRDETNVYRFSKVAGKADEFLVTGSKIVDGKEIEMGRGTCKYDEKKKAVECEQPQMRLTIDGKKMEGTLNLANGSAYRRIYLEREN